MTTPEGTSDQASWLDPAVRIFNLLTAALLLFAALTSLANGVRLSRTPFQLDYEEGNILNAGVRINAGLTPYAAVGSWPAVLNPYGPIPYYLTAILIRFGPPAFFWPRLAIVASAVWIAVSISVLANRFTHSWVVAISFGAIFITLPVVQEWTPVLRVDLMGLAFSLLGLCLFVGARRLRIAAVLFFVAALLCKITLIAAPVGCSAMLIKKKRWRELTYLVLGGGGILGAAVAALQWSTHGAFLFHQFETHVDPWSWRNYSRHITVALVESSTLVALALCGILRLHRFNQPLAYLIATGLGTVTLLKVGSASNHLLEFEAALCISAAVGMQQLQAMRRHPRATLAMVVTVGSVLAGGAVARRAMFSTAGLVDQCPQAYAYIQNHQAVLSENVGALLLTARPVLLSNPFVYAQLVRSGKWPDGKVEQMLREGTVDLVIIGKPDIMEQRWSQPALAALGANYHATRHFVCPDAVIAYEPGSKD